MSAQPPACSIVVPTRDRPAQLRSCLASLARLDYPRNRLQVVVVDDGGAVPLGPVVEPFRPGLDIKLLRQAWAGPATARNTGAAHAGGELLAFTDDDCAPRSDWLARLVDRLQEGPCDAAGGLTVNALADNQYSSAAQMIIDVGYAQHNRASRLIPFFTTNNLVVPGEGFHTVRGFDGTFRTAEDRDFCARWAASGRRIIYEPLAVVEHAHHLALRGFVRLHFAYGRGAFRYHRAEARRGRRVGIEPSFYAALVRRALRGPRPGAHVALLAAWHLANTAGFVWQWLCERQ